jgi:hypothetical protein
MLCDRSRFFSTVPYSTLWEVRYLNLLHGCLRPTAFLLNARGY